jgi:hypothetical protein
MKKKLFLIIALGLLITTATLSTNYHADDPPIWEQCPLGSTTCPKINP